MHGTFYLYMCKLFFRFVDLILREGAHVDVKNKKGNSPLWLAANGEVKISHIKIVYKVQVCGV